MVAAAALLALAGCDRAAKTPAPPPPDPTAQKLRAAAKSGDERSVYAHGKWAPAWHRETVAQFRQALGQRRAHALDRMDFAAGDPPAGATPEQADVARTRAALAYAAALSGGATDPKKMHSIFTLAQPKPDLGAGLAAALKERRVGEWLESLAPQEEAYRALSTAYVASSKGALPDPVPTPVVKCTTPPPPPRPVPSPTPTPSPSPDESPAADGEAPLPTPSATATPVAIDPPPVAAATPECVTVMQAPPRPKGDPTAAIAVAMERLRWMDRSPAATRIDVNIATARLTYWRDGAVADSRPVVVGAISTKTPQLGSPIFRLVANPTWTIPASIVRKDKMGARSAASLARSGMAWRNGKIVQKPGPRNSLGLVKFDMRNGYAIYLHDTPAKGLFAATERHRSHGCVRVKDALGFAAMLAGDEGIGQTWAKASARGRTSFINLPREIPVRLMYAPVLIGDDGLPVVRADPYGWDAPIAKRLGFRPTVRPVAEAAPADLGP